MGGGIEGGREDRNDSPFQGARHQFPSACLFRLFVTSLQWNQSEIVA